LPLQQSRKIVLRKFLFGFSFALFLSLTYASAQKNELGLVVGGAFSPHTHTPVLMDIRTCTTCSISRTIHIDSAVSLEGVYGRQIAETPVASLFIELPILGVPARRLKPAEVFLAGLPLIPARSDLASLFVTPSFKAKFLSKSPVSPFVSIGGGLAHYRSTFGLSPQNTGLMNTTTSAFQFGGGMDITTPIAPLGFRVEVRDFQTGEPETGFGKLDIRHAFAGVGAVFHF
jgi:hypothetical protein